MAMPRAPVHARTDDAGLDRAIGPWTLGANAVNLSLGAGIFALPAAVAAILGPAAILAYLICGLAIALVLTCFVEIGSQTTRSGGAVAYIEDSFGPMAGFVAWVVYTLVFCAAADAAISLVFVDAMAPAVPILRSGLTRAATLVALFGGLAAVNIAGVRHGVRLAVATTAVKVLPLVVVIVAGLMAMHWSELRWAAWPDAPRIGEASLLLFFAFSGAEAALTPGGEIRDPQRSIPRGILGGTVALVVVYVSVQIVSQGVLGSDLASSAEAPLAAVAGRVFGQAGWSLMIACTALAIFGTLAGDILASPRGLLPIAADGLLPAVVGSVHPRYRTPHVAIGLYAGLGCAMALSGAFRPLAILSSGSLLLVYFVVCLAALKLRLTRARPAGAFRAPGGPLVPVAGMITVAWLLAHSTPAEAAALVGTVAAAGAYYLVRRLVMRRAARS
ncbi:MAG: amino acid permease [Acidobacteria bacterium]|nr:amino acid permease [Acidobacteriota bacterium]